MGEQIEGQHKAWERGLLAKTLARFPESQKEFVTGSGRPVDRLYLPGDPSDEAYLARLGFPGQYPFTRGVQPTMYRGRLVDDAAVRRLRHRRGIEPQRYKYLLEQGQTGLSVAFDLPTQIGYDSDDPRTEGEVGKVGVAIDTLRDMETLFDGIPLDKVSTSMTINAPAAVLLAMYVAVAEKQGVPRKELKRHDPERHPQGVRRARHLDLPARAFDAADHRHPCLLHGRGARVEQHLHLGLPHPRGRRRRGAGGGLHPRRRHRLRRGGAQGRARRSTSSRGGSRSSSTPTSDLFEEVAKFRAARRRLGPDHARSASAPRTRAR